MNAKNLTTSGDIVTLRPNGMDIQTYLQKKLTDLETYKQFRQSIDQFIKDNLDEGVDFGKPYKGSNKKTLLLPGAQKIARLLNLRIIMFADKDTWEMLGAQLGIVCYSCYLIPFTSMGTVMQFIAEMGSNDAEIICKMLCVSEGRGAGYLENEKFKLRENALVKKVQKRAFVDAAIRIADLSDQFTQDMDDLEELNILEVTEIGATTVKEADITELDLIGEESVEDGTNELGDENIKEIDHKKSIGKPKPNPLAAGEEDDI